MKIENSNIYTEKRHISAIAEALKVNAEALKALAEAIKNDNSVSYGVYYAPTFGSDKDDE